MLWCQARPLLSWLSQNIAGTWNSGAQGSLLQEIYESQSPTSSRSLQLFKNRAWKYEPSSFKRKTSTQKYTKEKHKPPDSVHLSNLHSCYKNTLMSDCSWINPASKGQEYFNHRHGQKTKSRMSSEIIVFNFSLLASRLSQRRDFLCKKTWIYSSTRIRLIEFLLTSSPHFHSEK